MSYELICSWLGLPATEWPPTHYTLLGLKPGEDNREIIEERVRQRLDAVRRYQMCHPEQATEALNRLAQAYVCLTEPDAKKRYDAALPGFPCQAELDTVSVSALDTTITRLPKTLRRPKPVTQVELPTLASLPPPLPDSPPASTEPPPLPAFSSVSVSDLTPVPISLSSVGRSAPSWPAPTEKVDPIMEAARCGRAHCGLGTRRALYRRILRARRLFSAWQRAARYLGSSRRRDLSGAEGEQFAEIMAEIVKLRRGFARILGEAGQPGYMVVALARGEAVATYVKLELLQREALSRDWHAGRKLLLAYRDFLREQAAELRLMTRGQRWRRAVRAFLTDQPLALAVLVVLLAANFFLWKMNVQSRSHHTAPQPAPPITSTTAP